MNDGTERVRVVVCEDSSTYAAGLVRLLEHDGDLHVVKVCHSGEETIRALEMTDAQLITIDLDLPGISGLETVEHIMSTRPTPILVVSDHLGRQSEHVAAVLSAGALDAVRKSDIRIDDPGDEQAWALRRRARVLSGARVIRHPRARLRAQPPGAEGREIAVVGICASTGGPAALATLVGALPEDFPIPLLVVQHIGADFTEGLARWLGSVSSLPVRLAEEGAPPAPGVSIASQGRHLVLDGEGNLAHERANGDSLHHPSADVLFRSLARSAGRRAAAIVLTGMGRDGALGLAQVRAAGGLTITQDEASSVVFGMPKAAAELGAELVLSVPEIADVLRTLATAEAA